MTLEELEQLKADGMIDDRKYQQMKAAISMQGYQPGQQVAPSNAYNMTNYGKNLQAQAEPMEQNYNPSFGYDANAEKIAKLESQIAMIKERIARNSRALYGKSYEDANKKLATLEMDKIGVRLNRQPAQSDPTMLWRWNQGRLDTLAANANVKSKAAEQFANTVDMWKNTRLPEGTAAREQMISNLNAAIRDGRNAGTDVSDLLTLKADWEKKTYGNNSNSSVNYGVGSESEQLAGLLETALKNAKTSAELEQFRKDHPDLKSNQLSTLEQKIDELKKNEAAKAKANRRKAAQKDAGF